MAANSEEKGLNASAMNEYISSISLSRPGLATNMAPLSSPIANGSSVALTSLYLTTAFSSLSESLACTLKTILPSSKFSTTATLYSSCSKMGPLSSTSVINIVTAVVDDMEGWPPSRAPTRRFTRSIVS